MDQTSHLLHNESLQNFHESKTPVSVFLVNGISLHGYIEFFDNYMIRVQSTVTQQVYKHAISTVIPAGEEHSHLGNGKLSASKSNVVMRTKPNRGTAWKNR